MCCWCSLSLDLASSVLKPYVYHINNNTNKKKEVETNIFDVFTKRNKDTFLTQRRIDKVEKRNWNDKNKNTHSAKGTPPRRVRWDLYGVLNSVSACEQKKNIILAVENVIWVVLLMLNWRHTFNVKFNNYWLFKLREEKNAQNFKWNMISVARLYFETWPFKYLMGPNSRRKITILRKMRGKWRWRRTKHSGLYGG